jgi:hypothetical protein
MRESYVTRDSSSNKSRLTILSLLLLSIMPTSWQNICISNLSGCNDFILDIVLHKNLRASDYD